MTKEKLLKEIEVNYTKYRKKWIKRFGSDKGFDKWFTGQIISDTRKTIWSSLLKDK